MAAQVVLRARALSPDIAAVYATVGVVPAVAYDPAAVPAGCLSALRLWAAAHHGAGRRYAHLPVASVATLGVQDGEATQDAGD